MEYIHFKRVNLVKYRLIRISLLSYSSLRQICSLPDSLSCTRPHLCHCYLPAVPCLSLPPAKGSVILC